MSRETADEPGTGCATAKQLSTATAILAVPEFVERAREVKG